MALGTGSHWEAPILGSDKAAGGLCEEAPTLLQTARVRSHNFLDFINQADLATLTATQIGVGGAFTQLAVANGLIRAASTIVDEGWGSIQAGSGAQTYLVPTLVDTVDGLANRIISFEARCSLLDWSDCDWFIGIGGLDTTFMQTTGVLLTTGADNHVGFHHLLADGNDVRLSSAGAAVANTQVTLLSAAQAPRPVLANAAVDGVMNTFGIKVTGTQDAEFYLNGMLRHRRRMANALAASLTPTFTIIANATLINMEIDYFWTSSTR